jgi:hypothetical protein
MSPAGDFILNSFTQISQFYQNLYTAVDSVQGGLAANVPKFTAAIAPEVNTAAPWGLQLALEVLSTTFSVLSSVSWKEFGGEIDNFKSDGSEGEGGVEGDWTKGGDKVDSFLEATNT